MAHHSRIGTPGVHPGICRLHRSVPQHGSEWPSQLPTAPTRNMSQGSACSGWGAPVAITRRRYRLKVDLDQSQLEAAGGQAGRGIGWGCGGVPRSTEEC